MDFLNVSMADAARNHKQFRKEEKDMQNHYVEMYPHNWFFRMFMRWKRWCALRRFSRLYQTGGLVSRFGVSHSDEKGKKWRQK